MKPLLALMFLALGTFSVRADGLILGKDIKFCGGGYALVVTDQDRIHVWCRDPVMCFGIPDGFVQNLTCHGRVGPKSLEDILAERLLAQTGHQVCERNWSGAMICRYEEK